MILGDVRHAFDNRGVDRDREAARFRALVAAGKQLSETAEEFDLRHLEIVDT
jgi:hypothetical protein